MDKYTKPIVKNKRISHIFIHDYVVLCIELRHRKFCQYFTQEFGKVLGVNIFKKFNFFKCWQKLSFQNFGNNENIGKHSVCYFSTDLFGGRQIAKGGVKSFAKSFDASLKLY